MSTSEGSSSRIIRYRVSSDEYFEVKLNDLELYSKLDPFSYVSVFFKKRSTIVFPSSLLSLRIRNIDIVEILKKVEKYVTSSGEDMEYKLRTMFEDGGKKRWLSIKPGTVRIFSNDLISYYTGKSWRKINIR